MKRLFPPKPAVVMTGGVVFGERERLAHEYLQFREWTVESLLNSRVGSPKQLEVNWIADTDTVDRCVREMVSRDIGSMIVRGGETGGWMGIVTERDYLKKVLVRDLSSAKVRCEEIMTPKAKVEVVNLDSTLYECMNRFDLGKFRHLPVVSPDGNEVLAVFSQRDLVREFNKLHVTNLQYIESFVDFPIW
ncbi:hypothetical protein BASA81_004236 [Batrachochytrium salamandrivorans]|nr:hypothetical protein BASA81_004236 [Batrachochytrium salamandrivorans]